MSIVHLSCERVCVYSLLCFSCVWAIMFRVACLARAVVHFYSMTCNKACVDVDMCWFDGVFMIFQSVFA